jgi:hypothetical protein
MSASPTPFRVRQILALHFPGARHVVAGHLTAPGKYFSAHSNISNDERTTIHPPDSSDTKMSGQTSIKRWPLARRYF